MDYREYPVPPALRHHVRCVWRMRDATPRPEIQTIYPDGCCELIVHLRAAPRCRDALQGWHEQAPNLFAAQRVTAVQLSTNAALDCIGVRLKPAASALLTPRALASLHDHIVDLGTLDCAFCKALRRAMRAFAAGREAPLWRLLTRRCAGYAIDPRIEMALDRLERSNGNVRIDSVARAAALSMRGFQTLFRARVGLRPKEFARVLRLQATLRALDGAYAPLAVLADEAGFADQAHATREIKRVTGLTPARLRTELRRNREGEAAIRMAASFVRGRS